MWGSLRDSGSSISVACMHMLLQYCYSTLPYPSKNAPTTTLQEPLSFHRQNGGHSYNRAKPVDPA